MNGVLHSLQGIFQNKICTGCINGNRLLTACNLCKITPVTGLRMTKLCSHEIEETGEVEPRMSADSSMRCFWILHAGAPWRDLPPQFGGWGNTQRRFIRWRDKVIWEMLLERLVDALDYERSINSPHKKSLPKPLTGCKESGLSARALQLVHKILAKIL